MIAVMVQSTYEIRAIMIQILLKGPSVINHASDQRVFAGNFRFKL